MRLLGLFCFVCSMLNSVNLIAEVKLDLNRYRRFVEWIEVHYFQNGGWVELCLSDGTRWRHKVIKPVVGIKVFEDNTEAFIDSFEECFEMHLMKTGGEKTLTPYFLLDSSVNLPTLVSIDRQYKDSITCILSDGSRWNVKSTSPQIQDVKRWKVGDHVLISPKKNSDYDNWVMMNVDSRVWKKVSKKDIEEGLFKRNRLRVILNLDVEPVRG